jgi:hypothetical protein
MLGLRKCYIGITSSQLSCERILRNTGPDHVSKGGHEKKAKPLTLFNFSMVASVGYPETPVVTQSECLKALTVR